MSPDPAFPAPEPRVVDDDWSVWPLDDGYVLVEYIEGRLSDGATTTTVLDLSPAVRAVIAEQAGEDDFADARVRQAYDAAEARVRELEGKLQDEERSTAYWIDDAARLTAKVRAMKAERDDANERCTAACDDYEKAREDQRALVARLRDASRWTMQDTGFNTCLARVVAILNEAEGKRGCNPPNYDDGTDLYRGKP